MFNIPIYFVTDENKIPASKIRNIESTLVRLCSNKRCFEEYINITAKNKK